VESLLANRVLIGCVVAWLIAQISKPIIFLVRHRRVNLRYLATAGGMPSSHSAVVCALATGIGIESGLDSTLFAVGVIFAAVVMYDAAGVRRAVSVQARILNRMLTEMIEAQRFNEDRMRELIGHTPLEVFVGALLGTLTAISLS
jgi:uncharacterized protein